MLQSRYLLVPKGRGVSSVGKGEAHEMIWSKCLYSAIKALRPLLLYECVRKEES